MIQKIGIYLIRGLMVLFGSLPLKFHLAMGNFVAWLMGSVLKYRKDVVMINLSRSFPDKKYEELITISRNFYKSLGYIICEAVWFGASSGKRVHKQRIVEVANPEEMDRLFEASESVIILSGHYGNWEIIGGLPVYSYSETPSFMTEQNCCGAYKELSNACWDKVFKLNRTAPLQQGKDFPGLVESRNLVRYIYTHRGEKKFYNIINDQSPYSKSRSNIDLEFMHQPTKVMTAAAAVAHKFGFAVVYGGMRRISPGRYSLAFTPICTNAAEMETSEIQEKFYDLLQKDIEAQPENYLWSHKRWKHSVTLNSES